ncbi:MAG: TSUP family transporter [Bradyrhizobium sp.]|nr:TSUP family transporter [Bradyrhizobium sp.]
MADLISYGLLCFGVFAGAFVSGLAGFAFSAVAGVFVLHVRTPTETVPLIFRVGFGVFLAAYAAYMLFRPAVALVRQAQSRRRDAMVGFAGGFVGGLTAMPGALPTIWCDLRGLPKNQQRGLVQPFIATMQLLALLLMMSRRTLPTGMLNDFIISLPALLMGTVAGIVMFGRVNESAFRRVVLIILLIAGLGLLA